MHRIGTALALLALGLSACRKEAEPESQSNPPVTVDPAAAAPETPAPEARPFTPPADGMLRPDQARKFLLAHQALMKINEIYLDRLDTAGPQARRQIVAALESAREKTARKYGLNGFAEYRWILEEAPRNPENARLLRQLSVNGG